MRLHKSAWIAVALKPSPLMPPTSSHEDSGLPVGDLSGYEVDSHHMNPSGENSPPRRGLAAIPPTRSFQGRHAKPGVVFLRFELPLPNSAASRS